MQNGNVYLFVSVSAVTCFLSPASPIHLVLSPGAFRAGKNAEKHRGEARALLFDLPQ